MTVDELMKILSKYPPHLTVILIDPATLAVEMAGEKDEKPPEGWPYESIMQ